MPRARSGATLEEVTQNGDESAQEQPAAKAAPAPRTPPPLPTEKTSSAGQLEEKMVVIYGPPGVGKSTLASQWADGEIFFFNCSGELGELEVYQQAIGSWGQFREYAWSVKEAVESGKMQFRASAIDTADTLGVYCAEVVRNRLGIVHESDLDWGKGWSTLRDEWRLNLAKLASIPNHGLVLVTHSTEVEVKTRSAKWDKVVFRGVKGVRETMLDMADLVLLIDFAEDDDEKRVIKTKPSRYWDAKERGKTPRLPAEIEWPLGENGWEIIKDAWEAKA